MQQKIFIDNKEIDFLVVNKKGKIINNGDENFDTWEQTYVDLDTVKVGEQLSLSFNKGIHKRVNIKNYLHGKDEVKFVNKKGIAYIGRKWKSYIEDTYTTLDYKTTKVEVLDTEKNLISDDIIFVKDYSKLRFSEVKGIITVIYDEFILGNYKRQYDWELEDREYIIVNNEIIYLDSLQYFVDRNKSLISNSNLLSDIDKIGEYGEETLIRVSETDDKKRPYCIVVNNDVYTYKSEDTRNKDFKRLKFLFIHFFIK